MRHHRQVNARHRINSLLLTACSKGNMEGVKDALRRHANIHVQYDRPIFLACVNGHLDIVSFLLTSPELKEHARLKTGPKKGAARNQDLLYASFKYNQTDVVKFLCSSPLLKKNATFFDKHHKILSGLTKSVVPLPLIKFVVGSYRKSEHKDQLERVLKEHLRSVMAISLFHGVTQEKLVPATNEIFEALSTNAKKRVLAKALPMRVTDVMRAFLEKQQIQQEILKHKNQAPLSSKKKM